MRWCSFFFFNHAATPRYGDVEFRVEDRTVPAHRIVLAFSSSLFRKIFHITNDETYVLSPHKRMRMHTQT